MDEIRNVLPQGTLKREFANDPEKDIPNWGPLPPSPADLFGAIGHLARVAGLIGYLSPDPVDAHGSRRITLTYEEKAELQRLAKEWIAGSIAEIQPIWTILVKEHGNDSLRPRSLLAAGKELAWGKVALTLLLVADMAAEGLGRNLNNGAKDEDANQLNSNALGEYEDGARKGEKIAGSDFYKEKRFPASFTTIVDTDVVCVLPKSRITPVGCTLRNLSANLALLPPRGVMRCSWSQTALKPMAEDDAALDILLIPLPVTLNGTDFKPVPPSGSPEMRRTLRPNWENFEVAQSWLEKPTQVVAQIVDLVAEARKQTDSVDGIIFPEYALSWKVFEAICSAVWDDEDNKDIEFIIAGSSSNCEEKTDGKANYALTAINFDRGETDPAKRRIHISSRRKHHRWKLDRRQVADYALASSLNPSVQSWWEAHSIETPELYIHQFRQSSTFVTMICEDLARSDPCHEILRSVGPNLLFALLMDGPQLPQRWSARYATSLADDPGCSVLTFTSFGLVDRMNKTHKYDASRSIAMWKDETGNIEQIKMPEGEGPRAVLISLGSVKRKDQTIDGRIVENRSWRFFSQQPIVLPKTR